MKLTGIIEDVFNGRSIFRGYATLKHLAIASRPGEYQREADVRRLPEIKVFMENSQFSFFPELIFGLQLTDLWSGSRSHVTVLFAQDRTVLEPAG